MMRFSASIPTLLAAVVFAAGFNLPAHAGDGPTTPAYAYSHKGHFSHSGHGHARDDRLRPGFALGYGVAGTNTGNARYFEAPRSRTHGSTPPRLGPGGVYDRSVPQHQGHGYRHPHGHSRYHGDRYGQGYRDGYRDGVRDTRPSQRQSVGPGR